VAVGSHEFVLLVIVLEFCEGSLDAGIADQIMVTLLVAGVIARKSTGTIGVRTTGEKRLEDDEAQCDQRRSGQEANRQKLPFIEALGRFALGSRELGVASSAYTEARMLITKTLLPASSSPTAP
jgi:hypothetical protein